MDFRPQAPTTMPRQIYLNKVCGAGVTRLRDQSCAAPLVGRPAVSDWLSMMINDQSRSMLDLLRGTRLRRRPSAFPFPLKSP